ncbi:hypothetical protein Nepgr_023634 [Nepenthes gracilis]|uniref:TMEM205-like domain-containing protein n=1 Tax=Nepenthes gracilis TaxID=150966 RepID=A0AAD3XXW2_NEPGR|nr:hypothetical protein Nepgr_023634 [Nepenthes gracilis]
MMSLLAITLVLTTLALPSIFSPTPSAENQNHGEQVIVQGGHRAVLIEYVDGTGEGNTKVSISPPTTSGTAAKDKLSPEAASVATVAEEAKDQLKDALTPEDGHIPDPRELICDAFGNCKRKIAGAFFSGKEKAAETVYEVEEEAKEFVGGAVDKTKEMVCKVGGGGEKIGDKAKHVTQAFAEKSKRKWEDMSADLGSAREKAAGEAKDAEEMAEDEAKKVDDSGDKIGEKVKHASEVFVEKLKRAGEDISKDLKSARDRDQDAGKVKKAEEMVEKSTKKVEEKGEKGKEELSAVARRGKVAFCDALSYALSPESLTDEVHLLGFSTAYGLSVWVTFVMSYVLAAVLPRQQFAVVQSKIFPAYFKVMAFSVGVSLLGHLMGWRREGFSRMAEMLQGFNLLACLLFVLANLLFLEPRASKVTFEKMKLEKEEERGRRDRFTQQKRVVDALATETAAPVAATTTATPAAHAQPTREQEEAESKMDKLGYRMKKLNSYSSLLNIMNLMGLSWHLVYLSQRLHVTHQ